MADRDTDMNDVPEDIDDLPVGQRGPAQRWAQAEEERRLLRQQQLGQVQNANPTQERVVPFGFGQFPNNYSAPYSVYPGETPGESSASAAARPNYQSLYPPVTGGLRGIHPSRPIRVPSDSGDDSDISDFIDSEKDEDNDGDGDEDMFEGADERDPRYLFNMHPKGRKEKVEEYRYRMRQAITKLGLIQKEALGSLQDLGIDPSKYATAKGVYQQRQRIRKREEQIHANKLNPKHRDFNVDYAAQWGFDKQRRQQNRVEVKARVLKDMREWQELTSQDREPTPPPEEDSGDELYSPERAKSFQGSILDILSQRVPGGRPLSFPIPYQGPNLAPSYGTNFPSGSGSWQPASKPNGPGKKTASRPIKRCLPCIRAQKKCSLTSSMTIPCGRCAEKRLQCVMPAPGSTSQSIRDEFDGPKSIKTRYEQGSRKHGGSKKQGSNYGEQRNPYQGPDNNLPLDERYFATEEGRQWALQQERNERARAQNGKRPRRSRSASPKRDPPPPEDRDVSKDCVECFMDNRACDQAAPCSQCVSRQRGRFCSLNNGFTFNDNGELANPYPGLPLNDQQRAYQDDQLFGENIMDAIPDAAPEVPVPPPAAAPAAPNAGVLPNNVAFDSNALIDPSLLQMPPPPPPQIPQPPPQIEDPALRPRQEAQNAHGGIGLGQQLAQPPGYPPVIGPQANVHDDLFSPDDDWGDALGGFGQPAPGPLPGLPMPLIPSVPIPLPYSPYTALPNPFGFVRNSQYRQAVWERNFGQQAPDVLTHFPDIPIGGHVAPREPGDPMKGCLEVVPSIFDEVTPVRCNIRPTKRCEFARAIQHPHKHREPHYICRPCASDGNSLGTWRYVMEARDETRQFTCQPCAGMLQAGSHLQNRMCACINKIAYSWVCRRHRALGMNYIKLASADTKNWLAMRHPFSNGDICPVCYQARSDQRSTVWACRSCAEFVTNLG